MHYWASSGHCTYMMMCLTLKHLTIVEQKKGFHIPLTSACWVHSNVYALGNIHWIRYLTAVYTGDNALLCITNQTACCQPPYTGDMGLALGNWYFPNGTRVPSSGNQWDFYRSRGQMMVHLNRRRGGVEGIYIPMSSRITLLLFLYGTSHKKFSDGKQVHVGIEASKTNQTRW